MQPYFFLFSFRTESSTDKEQKQITVVFRFDDPSAITCIEIEDKLITAFRKYNVCCTFGVIPFVSAGDCHDPALQELLPLTPAKVEMLHQAVQEGVLEIALHGYSHQTNGLRRNGYSEFAGLDYEEQFKRIKQGKQFLEEKLLTPVAIFIPPWNSYDSNTVKALEQLEFQCLSADTNGVVNSSSSLGFLPATCSIWQLDDAIASARKSPDPVPLIVVLFHEFDFREISQSRGVVTFVRFIETLQWLSQQQDVSIVPMSEISNAASRRYLANQRLRTSLRLLPTTLPTTLRGHWYPLVFLSEEGVRNVRHRQCPVLRLVAFYGGLVLVVGIVSFLAAGVVFVRMPVLVSRLLLLSGPVLLACSLVWAFHDGQFGGRIRMAVAVLGVAAYCAGTWGLLLWHRHRPCKAESRQTIL